MLRQRVLFLSRTASCLVGIAHFEADSVGFRFLVAWRFGFPEVPSAQVYILASLI